MHSAPDKMFKSQQYRDLKKAPRRRPYCCDACAKQFETPSKLARHYLTHTGQKPYPCRDCSKAFRQLVHLERHMTTHLLPFQCDVCHRHFKSSETFSKHQRLHRVVPKKDTRSYRRRPAPGHRSAFLPIRCFGCQKIFPSEEKRLLHQCDLMNVTAAQKALTRRCGLCDKAFPSQSKLERHLLIHTGQKPFACALCGKAFRQKTHLRIHLITHSQEKPFQCNQCPKSFKMPEKLLKHQEMHMNLSNVCSMERAPTTEPPEVKQENEDCFSVFVIPFQCSSCGCCFDEREILDGHECVIGTDVPETYNRRSVRRAEGHLEEEILPQVSTPVGRLLKAEYLEESNDMDISTAEAQYPGVSKNPFQKGKLGGENIRQSEVDMESYFEHQQLGIHFSGLLENQNDDPICSNLFTSDQGQHGDESHSLHQFLQGAQGILLPRHKVNKCDQCNKTFPSVSKLRRHYLIHTGQKPFTCTECRKTFRQSAHLKRHQVTHIQKVSLLRSPDRLENYSAFGQQRATSFPLSRHCHDLTVKAEELKQVMITVGPDIKVKSESMDLSSGSQKRRTHKKTRTSVCKERSAKSPQERPMKKVRTRAAKKSYKCSVCTKTFLSPSKLERHYLMHAGQKPFECTQCGKSFRQDPHLKRHMQTHMRMKKKTEDVTVS